MNVRAQLHEAELPPPNLSVRLFGSQPLATRNRLVAHLNTVCGIAGWVGEGDASKLKAMIASVAHRGPDESGNFIGDGVALGIARLSIIDVADGHQPVFSEDESVATVCNGEIYNYRELAEDLIASGVTLRSGSDAEVIPHLYRKHGLGFVRHLRGMFAIALWDAQERRLVLARDRVGKKPLVHAETPRGLLFASEARALVAAGWNREANFQALDHVLAFGYSPTSYSSFEGVRSVPPGHIGVWQEGQFSLQPYFSWMPTKKKLPASGLGDLVVAALDEAVRIRLVSERPLGAFLSGGIDSTIITALMAHHHSGPIKTFSIGFGDRDYDESGFARGVADFLCTDHAELVLEPDPVSMLGRIAEGYDQPFADSSAIPTLLLSDLASEEVVVVLSGDGGDEAFGGYERYRAVPALQRMNSLLRTGALVRDPLTRWADRAGRRRLGRLARELQSRPSLETRYRSVLELIPVQWRELLWTKEAKGTFSVHAAEEAFSSVWQPFSSLSGLDQMRATDMATYLPGDLLTKIDIASMSCSLEVRSPFLDQEVLALAAQLPASVLVRGGKNKLILRELAYRLVPRHLVDRPKRGFGIPQAAWLRGPLREMSLDLLLDHTAQQRGWFNTDVIERLLSEHASGVDRDRQIWPLLILEVWARRWLDPGNHS